MRQQRIVTAGYKPLDGEFRQTLAGQRKRCVGRNWVARSTLTVGNIAFVTRNNVKMEMEDRLASGETFVKSDVETVRTEAL